MSCPYCLAKAPARRFALLADSSLHGGQLRLQCICKSCGQEYSEYYKYVESKMKSKAR